MEKSNWKTFIEASKTGLFLMGTAWRSNLSEVEKVINEQINDTHKTCRPNRKLKSVHSKHLQLTYSQANFWTGSSRLDKVGAVYTMGDVFIIENKSCIVCYLKTDLKLINTPV